MDQSCQEFFEQHADPQSKKCKLMLDINPAILLTWEKEPANSLSPGVVEDDEDLLQQIVDPVHVTDEGGLTARAFDAITSHGLSVHRVKYSTLEIVNRLAVERAEKYNLNNPAKPQRKFCGFLKFNTKALREIFCTVQNKRVFHIFDTATPDDISHAEVCQTAKDLPAIGTSPAKKYRFELYELVRQELLNVK